MQELLDRIKQEQEDFPAAQKQVAAYVVDNCYQIPFLSITSMAKNIGVSDSTIIKFCTQLGFEGFGEFKKVFSDYAYSELTMLNKLSRSTLSGGSDGTVFSEVLEEDTSNIQATLTSQINRDSLDRFLELLNNSENIYVTGGRSSLILAEHMASTLRYLGLKIHDLSGGVGDYLDRLMMIDKKDMVIAFCFPRYTAMVVSALRDLQEAGIPVVLFTDTGLSPAYPYADLVFLCNVSSKAWFPSYTSCMSLIGTICRAAGVLRKDSATSHVAKLEKRLLERGVFQ